MPRDALAKIFDVESTLKSGGEKASEGGDKRRKNGHDEDMQVVGRVRERRHVPTQLRGTKFAHENDDCGGWERTKPAKKTLRGAQISHSLQMKTGLGSHLISLQAFTPRSLTGQIIYSHRMNNVPQTMAKSMVLKKAPTKPSTVFFGESLMRGVRPMVIPQT